MSIRLGYQIPNISYGTPVEQLFPTVIAQAREAEVAGFDAVFVMDHFYLESPVTVGVLLPSDGRTVPTIEPYTALGGLATATRRIQLGTLVTGNTYRNPALLAKAVTTVDVVSGGRAVLGIGAGWYEPDHRQYGFELGTVTDRFQRLDEALQIIQPMLRGKGPTVHGRWYRAEGAVNEPRVRDDVPIVVGGGGEKKTFALAARFADHVNITGTASDLPRKLDALRARCAEVGRDPATLETSYAASIHLDEDGDRARKYQRELLARLGVDLDSLSESERRASPADRQFVGSPDDVAEQIQTRVLDQGIDGVIINMTVNGHEPGIVELAGRALRPLMR